MSLSVESVSTLYDNLVTGLFVFGYAIVLTEPARARTVPAVGYPKISTKKTDGPTILNALKCALLFKDWNETRFYRYSHLYSIILSF